MKCSKKEIMPELDFKNDKDIIVNDSDNNEKFGKTTQAILRQRTLNDGKAGVLNDLEDVEIDELQFDDKKSKIYNISNAVTSILLLNLVTIIWGTQHAVVSTKYYNIKIFSHSYIV